MGQNPFKLVKSFDEVIIIYMFGDHSSTCGMLLEEYDFYLKSNSTDFH